MYKINGFNLHDPARGWTVTDSTEWTVGTTIARPSLTAPGRDGAVPLPGYQEAPSLGIVVSTPHSRLNTLKTILGQSELTLEKDGRPGTALVQLNALTEERMTGGADPETELRINLTIPGVWLRGGLETYEFPDLVHNAPIEVFPGLTGKVSDAVLRLTDMRNPRITDSSGSFIAYRGTIAPNAFLLLDCATGVGWHNVNASWDSRDAADPELIHYGRGPGFLTITPALGEDPDTTTGRLVVTWDETAGAPGVALRGRSANIV